MNNENGDELKLTAAERELIQRQRNSVTITCSAEEKALLDQMRAGRANPVRMSDLTPEKINTMTPEQRRIQMQQVLAGNITD